MNQVIERERELLKGLYALCAHRSEREEEITSLYEKTEQTIRASYDSALKQADERYESERAAAQAEWEAAQKSINSEFETNYASTEKEYKRTLTKIEFQFEEEHESTSTAYEEAQWTAATVLEAAKTRAETKLKQARTKLGEIDQRIEELADQFREILAVWGQKKITSELLESQEDEEFSPAASSKELQQGIQERLKVARKGLEQVQTLSLPKWVGGFKLIWITLAVSIAVAGVLWFTTSSVAVTAGTAGGMFLAGLGGSLSMASVAKSQIRRAALPSGTALREARVSCQKLEQILEASCKKRISEAQAQHDSDIAEAEAHFPQKLATIKKTHDTDKSAAEQKYPLILQELKTGRDAALQRGETHREKRVSNNEQQYIQEKDAARAAMEHGNQQNTKDRTAAWAELKALWQTGLETARDEIDGITKEDQTLFPGWGELSDKGRLAQAPPPVLRFGQFLVDMKQFPHGCPEDEHLGKNTLPPFSLPALIPFAERCNYLLKAESSTRSRAAHSLQALMLRLLTAIPPGKVRFTIIDPIGLGENFAGFMHLEDYDEALVTNRIWTETDHIEQRLTDITEHMENVIQKYLRNEYQSIGEYNEQAGEVAEPFRVLVIAGFPVNFTAEAARRLVSIVASGARCGVHTLISTDMNQGLPTGFDLNEIEQESVVLSLEGESPQWREPDFGKYPLTLDGPPDDETLTKILHLVGAKARDAKRVEVPFEFVTPPSEERWSADSRRGIRVPLGRAGATKRQYLDLGKGTSQHVLVAGKTGSGKSTLLHALIVNTALFYSPDEIELYLIDFKKGVEFKTYAAHGLPHARVIAVESEREFGLSVLQRLDEELKQRGDLFRQTGVNDLPGFREARPDQSMPRIMLIVDEFQEFFVDDDKLARDAALLLDRLVRQGRAFGVHIMLGSQTLGGAFNPARSTIDQMAVRIALQCSETDANLILSAENSAARLLSRPGEAIYNDANGLLEGNDLFQVVFLPDERREAYLRDINELAGQRNGFEERPRIIFEGNKPADITTNHLLSDLISQNGQSVTYKSPVAWLGEAIAIKDPTSVRFRAQGGGNLLIVGQQEEAASGILSTMFVSLTAQVGRSPDRFFVLDGSSSDDAGYNLFQTISEQLGVPTEIASVRDCGPVLERLHKEIQRRQTEEASDIQPMFLFIHGLQRFRDLRRAEDDFSFGSSTDENLSPAKMLAEILKEGAALGIHTIIWCDSLNNVNRSLDRHALREFEQRVLFQMSGDDSSSLIDSPAAGRLGPNRALFYSEEQGLIEKFRPYMPPSGEWLREIAGKINQGTAGQ